MTFNYTEYLKELSTKPESEMTENEKLNLAIKRSVKSIGLSGMQLVNRQKQTQNSAVR